MPTTPTPTPSPSDLRATATAAAEPAGARHVHRLLAAAVVAIVLAHFWLTHATQKQHAATWAGSAALMAAQADPSSADWPARAAALVDVHPGLGGPVHAAEFIDATLTPRARLGEAPGAWAWTVSAPVNVQGQPVGSVRAVLAWRDLFAQVAPSLALALLVLGWAWRAHRSAQRWQCRLKYARHTAETGWLALFDACSDALVVCDRDRRIRALNCQAAELIGGAREPLVGRLLCDVLAGPLPDAEEIVAAEIRRPSGDVVPVAVRRVPAWHGASGERLWCLSNLTEQRHTAQRLLSLAQYDSLTGLPNRELFRDRLRRAMDRAMRSGRPMALMFLDLDRFKVVNDSLGHSVGDELLRHVARVLTGCLRSVDTVLRLPQDDITISRLGGDEFTVILEEIGGIDDASIVARRMLEALDKPFLTGHEEIVISASIGIALYPTEDVDLENLLRHADMAMYRSKSLGRNTFSFFSDDLTNAVKARVSLEGSLRRAVERGEFVLHYQPKVDLASGDLVGVEALLRWNCPGKGMVPPDRFIAVLEDTGLILPAGAWVIRTALSELEQWDRAGLPAINMAVNLSARQLRHQYLSSLIEDTLQQHRIEPQRLELEFTESLLMEDTDGTRGMLQSFARIGLRLAIDDFGTGHSSLAYLRRFKVDTLKIDRSFISETPQDSEACAVATAIVALGRSMQIKLVAEGVETVEQADFLRELGCHEIQGYLLTRPLPLPKLIEWYRHYQRHERPAFGGEPDTLIGGLLSLDDEAVAPA